MLKRLIEELCPYGVEYRKLDDLLDYTQPTKYIVKSTDYDSSFSTPVLTAGASFVLGYTDEIKNIYLASVDKPVIIFDDFTTSFHWVDFKFKVKSSALKILTNKNSSVSLFKFVYYAMQCITYQPSQHGRQWIQTYSQFKIPLPPIPIQEEVVRILDKFTLLKAELEAELEARTVQYHYYRDALLDMFSGVKGINLKLINDLINEFSPDKFRSVAISDVCVDVENIRWSENRDDVYSYIDLTSVDRDTKKITNTIEISFEDAPSRAQQIVKKDDVIYGTTRPTLQRYCIIPEEFDGQICSTGYSVLRSNKNMILPKFLYYLVSTKKFDTHVERYQRGSAYPAISDKDLKMFKIDLPPIPLQKVIVEILDRFETLIHDLQDGLPAEINLRQKQYEYYRDKLLTFQGLKDR